MEVEDRQCNAPVAVAKPDAPVQAVAAPLTDRRSVTGQNSTRPDSDGVRPRSDHASMPIVPATRVRAFIHRRMPLVKQNAHRISTGDATRIQNYDQILGL